MNTRSCCARSLRMALLAFLALSLTAHPALGRQKTSPPPVRQEVPDDPPAPRKAVQHSVPRVLRAKELGGLSTGVQVNVSPMGFNIVGDAANETSIAVDPTAPNRMAIGWRQFDSTASNFRQAGWAWTNDGGRTWRFPGAINPGLFRSDPVLGSDSSGRFFYYSLRVGDLGQLVCDMFSSGDGGRSWDEGRYAFGGDKAWMGIDRTGSPTDGNIYLSWSTFANCCGFSNFSRSIDGGLNFMNPIPQISPVVWGTIAVGPDGEFYIAGISAPTGNNDNFLLVKSTTAGDPSGPAFDFASAIDMQGTIAIARGPNPGGLLGQVWVDVDASSGPNRGNVYVLCSVDPIGDDPLDVHFVRSADGGVTWSPPMRLNDDAPGNGAWQWFGSMSVAPNGRIDVIFNDTRNDPTGTFSELFYTSSTDGGLTWEANTQLSPAFNHFLGYPNQNKLGDYYHMVSDELGANLAWAATFNGEQDVYYLRIGPHDCNQNALPDEEELAADPGLDCNLNGIPDSCDLAAGASVDRDNDGLPDECGDCNGNRIPDFQDIADGHSPDCNANGFPDECETDNDCDGNGVPDECDLASGDVEDCNNNGIPDPCDEDCNHNGQPDDCDLFQVFAEFAPQGPFGADVIPAFVLPNLPNADEDVELIVEARGDLEGALKSVDINLNGFKIGTVFEAAGTDCPGQPDREVFLLDDGFFNILIGFDPERDATFELVPSLAVDPGACGGASQIALTVRYGADTLIDQNGNGVPDECDPPYCHDLEATIWVDLDNVIHGGPLDGRIYFGLLVGTPGDDVIVGTGANDVLIGLGGDDVICALEGDDLVNANNGDDLLDGGPGEDVLHGGGGLDQCFEGSRTSGCENLKPAIDSRRSRELNRSRGGR